MHRRHLLVLLAAAPIMRLAQAADSDMSVAANQTTIESAPLFVGTIPGVRVMPLASGRVASSYLVAGKVDASTGNETQATLNSVVQPQLRIILTLAECRYRMVARRSAGIQRIADLRGKRITYTPGTSSEYYLTVMLHSAGLTLNDITSVKLEPPDMAGALVDRKADAMAIWEPHPQNAITLLGQDALVLTEPGSRSESYVERFNLNTTTTMLNDPKRRATLVHAVKAIAEVSRQLTANPKAYWPALSKAVGAPVGVIEKVWPHFTFPAKLDTGTLLSALSAMEPWAAGIGKRAPRAREQLATILDPGVAREAGI